MAGITPAEVQAQLYDYLHGTVVTSYLGQGAAGRRTGVA